MPPPSGLLACPKCLETCACRITFVTDHLNPLRTPSDIVLSTRAVRAGAGSSRIVLALTRGLTGRGHRVAVVADRIAVEAVRAAGGRPVYPLGTAGLQALARRFLGRGAQLALRERAVRRCRADLVVSEGDLTRQDVVLVHNIVGREVDALGAAASADHRRSAAAQAHCFRQNAYRLVIANSQLTRREFMARFGVAGERVAVVYPGVDPQQFSHHQRQALRQSSRAELGVGPGEFLVGFVSSGHFVLRGVDVLADTFARLPQELRQRIRLLGIGSDANTALLRSALARAQLGHALVARPRTAQIERHYHAADLLFHPALFETFGLVVIEAAACGTPVLTSRCVGAAELFGGDAAAGVVEIPDAALFAPLLQRLVTDPSMTAAIGASQLSAVRHRTWEACSGDFVQALESCPQ